MLSMTAVHLVQVASPGAPACNWRATMANVDRDVVEEGQRGEGKLMV